MTAENDTKSDESDPEAQEDPWGEESVFRSAFRILLVLALTLFALLFMVQSYDYLHDRMAVQERQHSAPTSQGQKSEAPHSTSLGDFAMQVLVGQAVAQVRNGGPGPGPECPDDDPGCDLVPPPPREGQEDQERGREISTAVVVGIGLACDFIIVVALILAWLLFQAGQWLQEEARRCRRRRRRRGWRGWLQRLLCFLITILQWVSWIVAIALIIYSLYLWWNCISEAISSLFA